MDAVLATPLVQRRVRRRAIFLVLAASALFTFSSAIIKSIGPAIPALELIAIRSLFALIPLLPLFARHGGWSALRTRHWGLHAQRTIYGFIGMITAIHGYVALPLVLVTALGFVMPLFLVALSVPLLGEKVGWRRGTAVVVGFLGVLVMVRPWLVFGAGAPVPLLSVAIVVGGVATWALAMIVIRKIGHAGDESVTITAWFTIGGAVMAGVLCVPVWVTPTWAQFLSLAAIGLVAGLAQVLMTEGYRTGETTVLAPFEYGAIVYATALGMGFWGEMPGVWDIIGIVIIVASGLYVWHREATLGICR
ncbi:MAG: DMT family transporter [Acetobacteraceae bacterium]|nr:DMT family transporter [Acetobacteraceae bacterium]MSP30007.1 DMT family transporter [Acetobacteraceae bacterium]